MAYTNITPIKEISGTDFTISTDFTGSDGDTNRTYTLVGSNVIDNSVQIIVDNASIQEGVDYNVTNGLITFLIPIYDDSNITFSYLSGTLVSGPSSGTYCTAEDVQELLQLSDEFSYTTVPSLNRVNTLITAATEYIDKVTGHSWRETNAVDEYYDLPMKSRRVGFFIPVFLRHRKIRTLDSNEGDKIEIWNGSDYEDWLQTKTEGRANDYYMDYERGILYLRLFYPYFTKQAVRLTYRWGDTTVPEDIRQAAAMWVAMKILQSDDRSVVVPETGDTTRLNYDARITQWKKDIDIILHNYSEVLLV